MGKMTPLTWKIYSSWMSFFPYFTIFLTHDATYPRSIYLIISQNLQLLAPHLINKVSTLLICCLSLCYIYQRYKNILIILNPCKMNFLGVRYTWTYLFMFCSSLVHLHLTPCVPMPLSRLSYYHFLQHRILLQFIQTRLYTT